MTTPYTLPEPAGDGYTHTVTIGDDTPSTHQVKRIWVAGCYVYTADQMQAAFAAGAASHDGEIAQLEQDYSAKCNELELVHSECEALRADAAKWREHVKPKIVGWMNPCNGVVISPSKKLSRSIGHGYPNFSVPVFAAIAAEGGKT